jgi:hypothetical protein
MARAPLTEARFRLLRSDDVPPSHEIEEPYEFGVQDVKQALLPPARRAGGMLAFDFTLSVKPGADPHRPTFLGRFASGPPNDRFVYLSWRSIPRGVWINRVKARLGGVDWTLARAAIDSGRVIEADMSGWTPHDHRRQVPWRLADA